MNPWDKSCSLRLSDNGRKNGLGGRTLTRSCLRKLHADLALLRQYFEPDGECATKINDCIEIVIELSAKWTSGS